MYENVGERLLFDVGEQYPTDDPLNLITNGWDIITPSTSLYSTFLLTPIQNIIIMKVDIGISAANLKKVCDNLNAVLADGNVLYSKTQKVSLESEKDQTSFNFTASSKNSMRH